MNHLVAGWRAYAWLAGIAIALYAVSLSFGFTYLDDSEFILENQPFIRDLSRAGEAFTQTIFTRIAVPYYRPLLTVSFMIDAQAGGASPFVYHVTNVLLHGLATCLLFALLVQLGSGRMAAFLFAGLFCVHPALAQAVAWIPGRNDTLLAVTVLAAYLSFLRYCRGGRFRDYLWTLVFFVLALFAKESAIILLALFAVSMAFTWRTAPARRDAPLAFAGWGAAACCWAVMRAAALAGGYDQSEPEGMFWAVVKSLPAFIQYVGKIFLPFNLSVYPTIRDTGFAYGAVSLAILAAILIASRRRDAHLIALGAVWFTLFLVTTFVRPTPECVLDFQEHRMYVPLIGAVIMLAGAGLLAGAERGRPVVRYACLAVAAVYCVLAFRHELAFRDRWSFWGNAVATSPHAAYIHLRAGFVYYTAGRRDRASDEFDRALALDQQLAAAHTKRGLVYLDSGDYAAAEKEFRKEIALFPFFGTGYLCLGVAYHRQGRFAEAERAWKDALRAEPHNADAAKNLALFYAERKDRPRASHYFRRLEEMGIELPADLRKEWLAQ